MLHKKETQENTLEQASVQRPSGKRRKCAGKKCNNSRVSICQHCRKPTVENVVMATGNLSNVRNAFWHRTDILHRKALPSVAFVDFTCIFEIRNAEKLILFLKSQWCTNILRQSSCHIASIALQSRDYRLWLA